MSLRRRIHLLCTVGALCGFLQNEHTLRNFMILRRISRRHPRIILFALFQELFRVMSCHKHSVRYQEEQHFGTTKSIVAPSNNTHTHTLFASQEIWAALIVDVIRHAKVNFCVFLLWLLSFSTSMEDFSFFISPSPRNSNVMRWEEWA